MFNNSSNNSNGANNTNPYLNPNPDYSNIVPSFIRFNDNLAFYKGSYSLYKTNSCISLINSNAEIVTDFDETITKVATFNDNVGIIANKSNSWFVDTLGNKTKALNQASYLLYHQLPGLMSANKQFINSFNAQAANSNANNGASSSSSGQMFSSGQKM